MVWGSVGKARVLVKICWRIRRFFLQLTCIRLHNCLFYMQHYGEFDDYEGSDQDGYGSLSPKASYTNFNSGDEGNFEDAAETLRAPRPQLRSRPSIDFAGRYSNGHSNVSHPPSRMSGSTLRPVFNLPHNAPSYLSSSWRFPPGTIESLTKIELFRNPLHCKLRQKHDNLAEALAMYLKRDYAESRVATSNTPSLVPDIHQGM